MKVERAKGIEPSYAAWEAAVLPLNYARASHPTITNRGRPRQVRLPATQNGVNRTASRSAEAPQAMPHA